MAAHGQQDMSNTRWQGNNLLNDFKCRLGYAACLSMIPIRDQIKFKVMFFALSLSFSLSYVTTKEVLNTIDYRL